MGWSLLFMALGFRVQWSTNWPLLLQTGLIPWPWNSESSDLPTDLCCPRQGSYPDPGIPSPVIYQLTFAAQDRAHTLTLGFRVQWSTNWPLHLQTGLIPWPSDSESSDLPTDLCCSRQGSYPGPLIQSPVIYQLTSAAPEMTHTLTLRFRVQWSTNWSEIGQH